MRNNYSQSSRTWISKMIFMGLFLTLFTAFGFAQSVTINMPNGQTTVSNWAPWVYSFSDPVPAGAVVTGATLTFTGKDQGWGGTGANANFYLTDQLIGSAQLLHYWQNYKIESSDCFPDYNYGGINTLKMYFIGYRGWQGFFRNGRLTIHYEFVTPLELTSSNVNQVSCNGAANGSISVLYQGGTQPSTVLWSNGKTTDQITGLEPGTYSVTVTDKCGTSSVSQSFTITEPEELLVDAGLNQIVYLGYAPTETATLQGSPATGGTEPYSYDWYEVGGGLVGSGLSVSVSPTESTQYLLTVTDANGCSSSDLAAVCAVDIAVPAKKNGKPSNKVYLCHIPEGNPANAHTISVSVNAVADHLLHGDLLGPCGMPQDCDGSFKSGVNSIFANIQAEDYQENLTIYPNPTNGELFVVFNQFAGSQTKVSLMNLSGATMQIIYDDSVNQNFKASVKVNTQSLSEGIYFVRLQSSNGTIETIKLVVN